MESLGEESLVIPAALFNFCIFFSKGEKKFWWLARDKSSVVRGNRAVYVEQLMLW